jgi:hypothetical protein
MVNTGTRFWPIVIVARLASIHLRLRADELHPRRFDFQSIAMFGGGAVLVLTDGAGAALNAARGSSRGRSPRFHAGFGCRLSRRRLRSWKRQVVLDTKARGCNQHGEEDVDRPLIRRWCHDLATCMRPALAANLGSTNGGNPSQATPCIGMRAARK